MAGRLPFLMHSVTAVGGGGGLRRKLKHIKPPAELAKARTGYLTVSAPLVWIQSCDLWTTQGTQTRRRHFHPLHLEQSSAVRQSRIGKEEILEKM